MVKALERLARSTWFWMILLGYILRVILMPITGQHDVMFMPWMTHYINQGHLNLYAFLHETYGDVVMQRPGVWAPYPYGFYLYTAGWLAMLDKISVIDLDAWPTVWEVSHPARAVFMLKLAYLPFDLAIGYLLLKTSGRLGFALWAWSPLAIYTPFMMGQNDIYPTAFAVAGTYMAARGLHTSRQLQPTPSWRPSKSAIWMVVLLGIGSIFKIYPLLLLPPLVLIVEKRWWQRLFLLALGSAFLALASLPFLTTPTYIDGVLFNHEGARIFREIQLFGMSVSPFLVSYMALLLYLNAADVPRQQAAHLPWVSAAFVLTMLFLWIPSPLYWLIWLIPFVIGSIGQGHILQLLVPWALLQIGFALALSGEHRELGVALPIHLADVFNVPNLSTTLAVTHPILSRIYLTLLPAVRSLIVIALLAITWFAAHALKKGNSTQISPTGPSWWIIAPTTVLLLILSFNLLLANDLVSRNNWLRWQPLTLQNGDSILQELLIQDREVSGVRLRFLDAVQPIQLEMCIFETSDVTQPPIACAAASTTTEVENRVLYVRFDKPVEIQTTPVARIRVLASDATLTLPFGESTRHTFLYNGNEVAGSLDISALTTFQVDAALNKLVVTNILSDPWLVLAISMTGLLVTIFLGVLFLRPQFST